MDLGMNRNAILFHSGERDSSKHLRPNGDGVLTPLKSMTLLRGIRSIGGRRAARDHDSTPQRILHREGALNDASPILHDPQTHAPALGQRVREPHSIILDR